MIKKNYNMKELLEIKKNLKKDFSNLKTIKVALLGDTATQFLTQALRGLGYDSGFNIDIWEADFDQIERQVYDLSSENSLSDKINLLLCNSDLYKENVEIALKISNKYGLKKMINKYKECYSQVLKL
tara:strand:- start:203 stop:583 length:381 start_codon:yes stop_codon:yes gene_type:complete